MTAIAMPSFADLPPVSRPAWYPTPYLMAPTQAALRSMLAELTARMWGCSLPDDIGLDLAAWLPPDPLADVRTELQAFLDGRGR
jgi:hypothetical protein